MTLFHAEKCRSLASKNVASAVASVGAAPTARQFLVYSTFVLVRSETDLMSRLAALLHLLLYPALIWRSLSGSSLWKFTEKETRVMWLSSSEDRMIVVEAL